MRVAQPRVAVLSREAAAGSGVVESGEPRGLAAAEEVIVDGDGSVGDSSSSPENSGDRVRA